MGDQEIDSGRAGGAKLSHAAMDPVVIREKGLARAAELRERAISQRPSRAKIIDGCPPMYRAGLVRALVGEASPKQAIRAHCAQCVGWEEVAKSVGECRSFACALWTHRPYQSKKSED